MQVNLSQVKAKVSEILARCGQQDVEKTCKWFLLWHNRSLSSSDRFEANRAKFVGVDMGSNLP